MKTKKLKINGQEKEGLLMAWGPGYKVYSLEDGMALVVGRKTYFIPDTDQNAQVLAKYANLPYFTMNERPAIEEDFKKLLQSLE